MGNISVILLLLHERNSFLSSLSPFPVTVASNHPLYRCKTERFSRNRFLIFNQLGEIIIAVGAFCGRVARSLVAPKYYFNVV